MVDRIDCRGVRYPVTMLLAVVAAFVVALSPARAPLAAAARERPVTLTLTGKVVRAELSGFEPDFDPIDRIVIAATLHDTRAGTAGKQALPDTMLVLSTYLENFQPDTTPVLPDLLHPNRTATDLGGWMQGKAVLVNRAGRTGYSGALLAEVFLDNAAHLVLDMDRVGAPDSAPSLRLSGALTLYKNLTVRGSLQAARPLSDVEAAALQAPPGRMPSWQTVVQGLTVHLPPMMGTGGAGGNTGGAQGQARSPGHTLLPPTAGQARQPVARAQASPLPFVLSPPRVALLGAALILLAVAALLRRRGHRRAPVP